MAEGDAAIAAGYPTVPDTGEENARVRWGAREINRTRDFIAAIKTSIPAIWPVANGGTGSGTKSGARANLGMTSGASTPANSFGADGDWYAKTI